MHDLEIAPEALRRRYDPGTLAFGTTAEVAPEDGDLGQERAARAIDFAVGMSQRGYNVFATGPEGTGKIEAVEARLRRRASARPTPGDLVFLFNFDDPARPLCAELPAGQANRFARAMSSFVQQAERELPRAFESESYQRRRAEAVGPLEKDRENLLGQVRSFARSRGLDLELTPAGVMTIALAHGRRITPAEFERLPEQTRQELTAASHQVEERIAALFPHLREIESRGRERVSQLDREVVLFAVGHLIEEIRAAHGTVEIVSGWLERVRQDVIDNYGGFIAEGEQSRLPLPLRAALGRSAEAFRARYEVSVFVADQGDEGAGAPVVVERNPTYPRLLGRIEFETSLGAATTDHRHIRAGSIHRARGGYLVLRAADVLRQPFVWDKLKEILRTGSSQIENPGEQFVLFPTATLMPDPVSVDVKVVLVGSGELHELMHAVDEDVADLFRVRAEFDVEMAWDADAPARYAAFVSAEVARHGLLPFTAEGVGRILEEGARWAAHQGRLSTRAREIGDLVAEASNWARQSGAAAVAASDVERAVQERRSRSDLLEQRLATAFAEGTLHLEMDGHTIGQVNGLAVSLLADYAFGHPARITATTAPGPGELVSIDRESKLTGRIHDKGFLTLRGYLEHHYGERLPLSLTANLTFEQSYSMMDGDSASSAELYALLSSLAQAPIDQGIAVTGSVDQHGRVQAVGGVTEKIEGFFDYCRRAGLTGRQGVIIPASNTRHLMLDERVIAAVREGRFHVWAVETIDHGIEILTGVPAGAADVEGRYPDGTLHRRVHERLRAMALAAREWTRPPTSRTGGPDEGPAGSPTD